VQHGALRKGCPGHRVQRYHSNSSFHFFSLTPGAVLWDHTKHMALMHQTTNFPHFFPLLDDIGHDIWGSGRLCWSLHSKITKVFKKQCCILFKLARQTSFF